MPSLSITGHRATGKSHVLARFLQRNVINTSWVNCHECVSVQTLLDRVIFQIAEKTNSEYQGGCDGLTSFVSHIKRLMSGIEDTHIVVLDRIDQVLESLPPTAIPVLIRLRELVRSYHTRMLIERRL